MKVAPSQQVSHSKADPFQAVSEKLLNTDFYQQWDKWHTGRTGVCNEEVVTTDLPALPGPP
jgi:hypothetical protein